MWTTRLRPRLSLKSTPQQYTTGADDADVSSFRRNLTELTDRVAHVRDEFLIFGSPLIGEEEIAASPRWSTASGPAGLAAAPRSGASKSC